MMSTTLEQGALLIDGEARAGAGAAQTIIEPATGATLAEITLASRADVDAAVAAALDGKWGRVGAADRSALLHRLADAIEGRADELTELEARNVGKAITSVRGEVRAAAGVLRYFASVPGAVEGRSNPIGGSLHSYSVKQPVGVCAQIVPWNYPLSMATAKIAPALAAGCSTVLKPDAQTPLSALLLARLALEAGLPPGVLNVVPGDGPGIGAYLVAHPGVDKVSFTGSTASGTEVMRSCADSIKRLTLELGGKSPSLVFADADLERAAAGCAWSVYGAAGQSCEARSRVLVERSVLDDFTGRFLDRAAKLRVGDPLEDATQIGSLISRAHRDRVHSFVEGALAAGAEVLRGGTIPAGDGAFYPPTAIADPDHGLDIERSEVFGPVATIVPFDDEADAIRLADDTRFGLMATIWTGDPARGPRIAGRLDSGTVGINMPFTSFPGVPFGGFKQSGFGREFGFDTLDDYLETKSVIMWTGRKSPIPID